MAGGAKAKIVASRISSNCRVRFFEDLVLAQPGRPVRSSQGVKVR